MTRSTPYPPDPEVLAALPHIFVDRSIGAVQAPALLRAAGFVITTMREHYGEFEAQRTADTTWIELTAERGWIAFHKDANIRRNRAERHAVQVSGARMFCVPKADLTAAALVERFVVNAEAIADAVQDVGPFIYSVQPRQIVRLL